VVNQGFSVQQILSQKQNTILAPQLQQGVRVLQLSSLELQNEIDAALTDNPFLEKMEMEVDFEINTDSLSKEQTPGKTRDKPGVDRARLIHGHAVSSVNIKSVSGSTSGNVSEAGTGSATDFLLETASEPTLHAFLRQQAYATPLSDKQLHILEILIDSVNDKGYLRVSIEEATQLAMPDFVVTRGEVASSIKVLQDFEPVGVGARTSSECLLLQLREMPDDTPGLELARNVVSECLLLMAQKKHSRIAQNLGSALTDVNVSCALIRQLDPFPGLQHAPMHQELIAPDLIVKRIADTWVVRLNPNLTPALSIHHEADDLLKLAKGHDGYEILKQSFQDAKVLLSNIERRYQTLLSVATLIIERQGDALEQGEAGLKPLTQKEIADLLGIHVSTVSRAVNDKYILTPDGVVELRSLFCSAISRSGGEDISSRAIQVQIKALIEGENTAKPLSDNKITEILRQRGIRIARRTVMKYREKLDIGSSPKRRQSKKGA